MSHNTVRLVFGHKGRGKSYFIKRELDKLRPHVPLLVWDYNREYAGPRAKDPIKNARVFASFDEFLAAQRAQPGHIGRAVVHSSRQEFDRLCTFALRCGGLTVVLDELHLFLAHEFPESFRELIYRGRHLRCDVYCAAWRPFGMPNYMRTAGDEIRAFQTTEPRDLDWFAKVCGANFAKELPRLRPHRSAVWRA